MDDDATRAALDADSLRIVEAMANYTEPYTASINLELSRTEGRLVGTGTYLRLRGKPYLLTNEHVARARLLGSLGHVLKKQEYVFRIIHPFQCLSSPADAAIARIDIEHFTMGDRKAVTPSQIAHRYVTALHEFLFIHGFPSKHSRMSGLLGGLISRTVPYLTQEMALPQGHDVDLFFAIHYPYDKLLLCVGGGYDYLPDPHGMSGSTVWDTGFVKKNGRDWSPKDSRVVGLIWGWDQPNQALIGVRIETVRQFLVLALCHEAAYFRWLERGQPKGDDWRDWFWATEEIKDIE